MRKGTKLHVTNAAVSVFLPGGTTITVRLDKKESYLVAVNRPTGGPTETISR